MNPTHPTPFERDIAAQPEALRAFAHPGHVCVRQQDHHHAVTRRRPGPVI